MFSNHCTKSRQNPLIPRIFHSFRAYLIQHQQQVVVEQSGRYSRQSPRRDTVPSKAAGTRASPLGGTRYPAKRPVLAPFHSAGHGTHARARAGWGRRSLTRCEAAGSLWRPRALYQQSCMLPKTCSSSPACCQNPAAAAGLGRIPWRQDRTATFATPPKRCSRHLQLALQHEAIVRVIAAAQGTASIAAIRPAIISHRHQVQR